MPPANVATLLLGTYKITLIRKNRKNIWNTLDQSNYHAVSSGWQVPDISTAWFCKRFTISCLFFSEHLNSKDHIVSLKMKG